MKTLIAGALALGMIFSTAIVASSSVFAANAQFNDRVTWTGNAAG